MNKPEHQPASAPDGVPPRPESEPDDAGEGTNAVQHHPDPEADKRAAPGGHKPRSPYVTGND